MRIRVRDVLELYAAGLSSEQILADYPDLEPEDPRVSGQGIADPRSMAMDCSRASIQFQKRPRSGWGRQHRRSRSIQEPMRRSRRESQGHYTFPSA